IRKVQDSIKNIKLHNEINQESETKKRYPQQHLFPEDVMMLDKNAVYIRPEQAVISAANQAEAHGAVIHRYSKVEEILPDNDGVTITANGDKYRVGKVLITTGAWKAKLMQELERKVEARRLVLTWFAAKNIDDFRPDKFPIFARMRKDFRLTGTPTLDGTMVKASNTKDPGIVPEPGNLNRDVS